jgi:ketosteroid isomerase-like protein
MAETSPVVRNFMRCLREAENHRETKSLCELFAENAELVNITRQPTSKSSQPNPQPNPSVKSFWSHYLGAFDRVESHFLNVIDDGSSAVLEWRSSGRLPMGLPVEYSGVSILEYEGDRISKFRTYYDSGAFLHHVARDDKRYSETVGLPEITNQATS